MPIHPHLHPVRASRPLLNDDSSEDSFNSTLSDYRISLYKMLNSERWGHQRTGNQLKTEISRRESAESELHTLQKQLEAQKQYCENLQNTIKSSDITIQQRNSERFSLYQENIRLRADLISLQAEREVSYCCPALTIFDLIFVQRESNAQCLILDMTPAKDRQIQVLQKRLSRQSEEGKQAPAAMVAPLGLITE